MTKMTKNILMVGGVAIVGYLIYKQYGNKPPRTRGTGTSSFTADEEFFNLEGIGTPKTKETGIVQAGTRSGESIGTTSCEVVSGVVAYAPMYLSNNRVVVRTGNGTTTICPRGQRYDLPR